MTEIKHTPGEWRWKWSGSARGGRWQFCICAVDRSGDSDTVIVGRNDLTSYAYSVVDRREEAVANAAILSAAPNLLEAAGMALSLLRGENIVEDQAFYSEEEVKDALAAAVAKATGSD